MKKGRIITAVILIALTGLIFWLWQNTSASNLQRTEVTIDLPDTFEK